MKPPIFLLAFFSITQGYLHIEDLRKMVMNEVERKQLRILDKEMLKPRNVVRQQVALIANNQSEQVQKVYQLFVTVEELENEANYEMEMTVLNNIGASPRILELRQNMRTVEQDLSLSRKESAEQIRDFRNELKRSLTKWEKMALDRLNIVP